jgi:hypothetical protein
LELHDPLERFAIHGWIERGVLLIFISDESAEKWEAYRGMFDLADGEHLAPSTSGSDDVQLCDAVFITSVLICCTRRRENSHLAITPIPSAF